MKKYIVEITETLQRQIEVKAESEEEAIVEAECLYRSGEVILDSEDYIGYELNLIMTEGGNNEK